MSKDPNVPIIELKDVEVVFTTRAGSILHPNKVKAVNKVNLRLMPGKTIGIVGESGCGKSTTANVMCGLQQATSGQVLFKGQDVTHRTAKERMEIGRVVSVVFQDPATALNARMSVIDQLWTCPCARRSSTCCRISRSRWVCPWCSSAMTSRPSAMCPTKSW